MSGQYWSCLAIRFKYHNFNIVVVQKQFKGGDKIHEEELKTKSADTASLVSLTKNLSINSRPFKSSV